MQGESEFTEETWASWLEPFQAIRLLVQAGLEDRESAVSWLKGRLRNGELTAAGWHPKLVPDDPLMKKTKLVVGRYKRSTWDSVAAIPWKDDFWVSGDYVPDDPLGQLSPLYLSIGVQSGPPIGVQKGPLCGCEDRLTLGAVFALLAA